MQVKFFTPSGSLPLYRCLFKLGYGWHRRRLRSAVDEDDRTFLFHHSPTFFRTSTRFLKRYTYPIFPDILSDVCLSYKVQLQSPTPHGVGSSPSRGGDVTVYVLDINQPSLPTLSIRVLASVSFFTVLSTVFRSINSHNNSPFCLSVLPVLFLLCRLLMVLKWIRVRTRVTYPDLDPNPNPYPNPVGEVHGESSAVEIQRCHLARDLEIISSWISRPSQPLGATSRQGIGKRS